MDNGCYASALPRVAGAGKLATYTSPVPGAAAAHCRRGSGVYYPPRSRSCLCLGNPLSSSAPMPIAKSLTISTLDPPRPPVAW